MKGNDNKSDLFKLLETWGRERTQEEIIIIMYTTHSTQHTWAENERLFMVFFFVRSFLAVGWCCFCCYRIIVFLLCFFFFLLSARTFVWRTYITFCVFFVHILSAFNMIYIWNDSNLMQTINSLIVNTLYIFRFCSSLSTSP